MTQDAALTAAFDPAAWLAQSRQQLLSDAGLTSRDLQRAVRRHRKLLNATRVKHIVRDGVIEERVYDDNETQLRAVDLHYELAGVKAPKSQHAPVSMGVEVVIDPASGQVIVRAISK